MEVFFLRNMQKELLKLYSTQISEAQFFGNIIFVE